MFNRHLRNPLITPAHVRPSRADFRVIGTFNPGAVRLPSGETLLLLRVAEQPAEQSDGWVTCPHQDRNGDITILRVRRDDPDYDTRDPRVIRHRSTGRAWLTSISHIRRARSSDGVHFTIDDRPWLWPETELESYGVEDARITPFGDEFLVNYSAVSANGIATGLIATRDFETFDRLGVIFPPSNRDVAIFPERIGGHYVCYHRPMPGEFGTYSIWMATSPDLKHWGDHQRVLAGSPQGWDSGRVGGGAPPLWTEHGWLSIYHAADRQNRYCLGAFLSAHEQPERVLCRSPLPILEPDAPYERAGFFPNVVFTCGVTRDGDRLRVYYGAADDTIALADVSVEALCAMLTTGSHVQQAEV
jgi:predicted GH43/DUF377 family glycosyl hydrolase